MPGPFRPSHHADPPSEGTSTAGLIDDGDRKRRGVVRMRFVLTLFFLSPLHRIAISPELAAMDSAAGTAAVLARARSGRRGHLSGRQSRGTAGDFSACVFLYNDFADWTALLFFVKI